MVNLHYIKKKQRLARSFWCLDALQVNIKAIPLWKGWVSNLLLSSLSVGQEPITISHSQKQKTDMNTKIQAKFVSLDTETGKIHVTYKNKRYVLPVLPFQEESSFADKVFCTLGQLPSGKPYLQLDYEKYIREKYNENDEADFRIISTRSNYYELRDERYGLKTKIAKQRSINPALSTRVRCRITNIKGRNISVTLADDADYEKNSLSNLYNLLAAQFQTDDDRTARLCRLITDETSQEEFSDECRKWIVDSTAGRTNEQKQRFLRQIKSQCTEVIGSPRLLPQCSLSERSIFEKRISNVIEQTAYFILSCEIYTGGRAKETLDDFFETLKRSGFHYHPRTWFSVALNIFLLDFGLMLEYVPKILEVLQAHKTEVWRRPPIDSLWIEMLEYFIQKANGMIYRETSDRKLEKAMIQLLVIQLRLNENKEYSQIDEDLNRAILYRIIARQNINDPANILRHAFGQITGAVTESPFLPAGKLDTEILANVISNQLSKANTAGGRAMRYTTDTAAIHVSDGNIRAVRKGINLEEGRHMLDKLQLAFNLDVVLDEKIPKDLHSYRGLTYYKQLWRFINQTMFERRAKRGVNVRMPAEGEEVRIIVLEEIGKLRFRCKVIDKGMRGEGILDASRKETFTPYTYPIALDDFYKDGLPLVLDAQVKETDEDGRIFFSLRETLQKYFDDYKDEEIGYDTPLYCCLNSRGANISRFPAVSMEGLPLSVGVDDMSSLSEPLKKGMVVEVTGCERRVGDFLNATFVRVREDMKFNPRKMIRNLLLDYSRGEVYEGDVSQDAETAEEMEKSHLVELMSELETVAALEKDSIRTYNYLSCCQLLANMLGDADSVEFYKRRCMLLEMLYDFETNNRIQDENLPLLSDDMTMFENNTQLHNDVKKLRIVSWMGRKEHEEDLYDCCRNETDEAVKELAQLVQAFNYVDGAGLGAQAEAIRDLVRSKFHLKSNTSTKHYYGQENDVTEFKTSLIIPAGETKPNPPVQTTKVLEEICAMLNAQGGTIYIGVNDAGYECGLEDDLSYKDFKGSLDKYKTYLDNNVANQLGQEAASIVKTGWDAQVKSDVLVVRIAPCPHPVSIHGDYYERMGTSARKVDDDYKPIFLRNRKYWAEQNFPQLFAEEDSSQAVDSGAASPAVPQAAAATAPKSRAAVEKIMTSSRRNNILHDYIDDYIPSAGYIYFSKDGKYKVTSGDLWEEEDHIMTLSVHEEELDAFLILVYGSGAVAKVRLKDLLDKKDGGYLSRYTGDDLLFATIASDDDCVILGMRNTKTKATKYFRATDISEIETCKMQQAGKTLTDVEIAGVFCCDVLPAEMLGDVDRNLKRTSIGHTVISTDGKKLQTLARADAADV